MTLKSAAALSGIPRHHLETMVFCCCDVLAQHDPAASIRIQRRIDTDRDFANLTIEAANRLITASSMGEILRDQDALEEVYRHLDGDGEQDMDSDLRVIAGGMRRMLLN